MSNTLDEVSIKIGDAKLTIPADSLAKAWMEKNAGLLGINTAPPLNDFIQLEGPKIGKLWQTQGGVLAGMMRGVNGNPDYWLIVPTDPQAQAESLPWGESDSIEGAKCEFDGLANTTALAQSKETFPAAQFVIDLELNGFSDYYLPARRELSLMYANVPELFEKGWHWSSTQSSSYSRDAWMQNFYYGGQDSTRKGTESRVRAVRRVLVIE